MFKELKNGRKNLVYQIVFKLQIKQSINVWINNSKTAWPTFILMLFLSSLIYHKMHVIFQKNVGNFEIGTKLAILEVGGAVPPYGCVDEVKCSRVYCL